MFHLAPSSSTWWLPLPLAQHPILPGHEECGIICEPEITQHLPWKPLEKRSSEITWWIYMDLLLKSNRELQSPSLAERLCHFSSSPKITQVYDFKMPHLS